MRHATILMCALLALPLAASAEDEIDADGEFADSAGEYVEYDGFREAYNFTSKNCDFFRNSDLDGDAEKEPV